jgi:hypothetical protein
MNTIKEGAIIIAVKSVIVSLGDDKALPITVGDEFICASNERHTSVLVRDPKTGYRFWVPRDVIALKDDPEKKDYRLVGTGLIVGKEPAPPRVEFALTPFSLEGEVVAIGTSRFYGSAPCYVRQQLGRKFARCIIVRTIDGEYVPVRFATGIKAAQVNALEWKQHVRLSGVFIPSMWAGNVSINFVSEILEVVT